MLFCIQMKKHNSQQTKLFFQIKLSQTNILFAKKRCRNKKLNIMEKVSFTYLSLKTGKCCNLLCLCIYNLPSDSLKFMWTIQEKTKKELRKCPQIKRFLGITFCTMSAIYICPLTSCQNWYTVNYVKYSH